MRVYITRINGSFQGDILQYMQAMAADIAHQLGCREMGIYRYDAKTETMESRSGRLDGIISGVSRGDIAVCQFPTGNGIRFERDLVNRLKAYQVRNAIFIYTLRNYMSKNNELLQEAIDLYNLAEVLIVPSVAMRQYLTDHGVRKNMKFVILEMWDCISHIQFFHTPEFRKEVHFVDGGRFEGINSWKNALSLKLYTFSSEQRKNVHYMGKTNLDEQTMELSRGGFGLVWYRDEQESMIMKYDVPFSLGRYFAAGIPVIVPTGISNQRLIENNHLGMIVDSIEEVAEIIETMKFQNQIAIL